MKIKTMRLYLTIIFSFGISISLNCFGENNDSGYQFVTAHQLVSQPKKYIGKNVEVLGFLVPSVFGEALSKPRLIPSSAYTGIDDSFIDRISIPVEFKNSVIPEESCLNRYVMVYGRFGESGLGFVPAIIETVDIILVEKENKKFCKFKDIIVDKGAIKKKSNP
jgi:hypothetical protein